MKTSFRTWNYFPLIGMGLLLSGGCGQVTGPLSPLINPPVSSIGSFDNGSLTGSYLGNPVTWVYDSANPNITNPLPLTVTSQAFQGPYAMAIEVPAYGLSGGNAVELSSYSVHCQIVSAGQGLDLTNSILSMWVKLESGVVTAPNQIGAQIFIKDGPATINSVVHNYQYANGTFVKLVPNQWMQVTYNVNAPNYQANPPPDVTNVYQIGLQLAGNGSSFFTSPGEVDADSLGWETNP